AENLLSQLQIGVLQDSPGSGRVEPLHELRRAGWMQSGAELMQLERVVLRQHLAQFGQEQRVDHDALARRKKTKLPAARRCKRLRGNVEYRGNRRACQRRSTSRTRGSETRNNSS